MKNIYRLILIFNFAFSCISSAQCLTPYSIPYYEGFQGITANNQLPACWSISNPSTCLTYTSAGPGNYAAFYYLPSGDNYFYSHAIQLFSGVTYSMSCVFRSESVGTIWTDFSMFIAPNQSTTGLMPVASTNSTVVNLVFTPLSNTFAVPTSGNYYAAIKATSSVFGGLPYQLRWDDLLITIPCTATYNKPNVGIVASATSICSGDQIIFTGTGANTYTWSTGATTNTMSNALLVTSVYTVIGTSTLSGCTATASISIIVKPTPLLTALANNNGVVCAGSPVTLTAQGANSYTWSEGSPGAVITVYPLTSTGYTVAGTNLSGCTSTTNIVIAVNPLPVITVTNTSPPLCVGEPVVLNATGAGILQWNASNGGSLTGTPVTFTPSTLTSTLTVFGTDINNCVGRADFILTVNACTGLEKISHAESVIRIYPNPGQGEFILESANSELKTIVITDVLGKIIYTGSGSGTKMFIDLSNLSGGIYLARVYSGNSVNTVRLNKQD